MFSSKAAAFAAGPIPATDENREAAIGFVHRQAAQGLTNFEAALTLALNQEFPEGRGNQVVFLTDGHATYGLTDVWQLDDLTRELAGDAVRIFTIGVGDGVNRGFLDALAAEHRGTSHFLDDAAGIEEELRDLFEELTQPVFLATELSFVATEVHDTHLAETDQSQELIPRLWAHQRVLALEREAARFGDHQELRNDILHLGLTYRLVTRMTALFAPDESVAVNPTFVDDDIATAVEKLAVPSEWFGKTFYLRDAIWVDEEFEPQMPVQLYEAAVDALGACPGNARSRPGDRRLLRCGGDGAEYEMFHGAKWGQTQMCSGRVPPPSLNFSRLLGSIRSASA